MRFCTWGMMALITSTVPALGQEIATPYPWTGFHAGLNGGYGIGGDSRTSLPSFTDPQYRLTPAYLDGAINLGAFSTSGPVGGAQLGYDRQFSRWLVGIEADWQASGIQGSRVAMGFAPDPPFNGAYSVSTLTQRLQWLATLRPRVGIVADNWVLYGTGGLALGQVENTVRIDTVNPNFNDSAISFSTSTSSTKLGWVGGIGAAYGFGRWSAKFEYLHYELGADALFAPTTASNPNFVPGTAITLWQSASGNIVRTGLDFHF